MSSSTYGFSNITFSILTERGLTDKGELFANRSYVIYKGDEKISEGRTLQEAIDLFDIYEGEE